MPSFGFMAAVVLIASIAVLFWVMALAQRQFEPSGGPTGAWWARRPAGSEPGPGSGPTMASELRPGPASRVLSQVVASAMDPATRVTPRNSAEAQAVVALRSSLALALQGEFAAEVRAVIERVEGVQSWHDIRKLTASGPTIAHLAVGPQGVFVIDSVVCSSKLSYDAESVFVGRGPERSEDPMIGALLDKVAALEALVEPATVQGIIVLEDRLSLPPEIRSRGVLVGGVWLLTMSQLPARLTTGLPLDEVLDVEAIWARLFPAFGPAVESPGHPFAAIMPSLIKVGR